MAVIGSIHAILLSCLTMGAAPVAEPARALAETETDDLD